MAFDLPDGKKARNIQEQVAFLTEKVRDLIAFVNQAGLKSIEIVEELPAVGDPTVLYLLQREDPEEGDYYEEYLWIDDAWEKIGTTRIDLSDYCTLSTDQTITGVKTFKDKISFLSSSENHTFTITADTNGSYYLGVDQGTAAKFGGGDNYVVGPLRTTNQSNLGTSDNKWNNLYLIFCNIL